ncbi:Putative disease resistance protein RGA4 [Linum grandiflorum]
MVAQIVSSIIGQLGSLLTEELKRRGNLVVGADKDVKKLKSTFSAIEALLLDAEERQLTDKAVEDWVTKLKNVCYQIDDVLDEWRTEILKRQLGDEISNILRRVRSFLPTYCFSPHEIGVRYDIASRIKELYEDLEHIDESKNMFNFTATPAVTIKSLETSSNIIFSYVKGREEEIKILKEKLLHVSDGVQSISIQGTGGFGKTTLAKLLYNDEAVKSVFDKNRIWVCVSDTFDPSVVAGIIIKQLSGNDPNSNTLSSMFKQIHDDIEGKRFLLILDDVWEGNHTKWQELQYAISSGSPGSKLLVTTRKGEVSRALSCIEDDVILIGKVPDDVCEAIFTQVAFHGWNAMDKERVEGLCKDAVGKCDGSPLAAKVLGGVMQGKKSKNEWVRLLKSEMWNLKEVREEIFGPLALSYYDLTPELRQCFQFCAVFPKDYEMDKDQLIKLWISQGFVGASGNEEAEDIGEEYFEILAARSFFQDFRQEKYVGSLGKAYYKMHDLVHDFAQLLSKGECISMTRENMRDINAATNNNSVVRNLMLDYNSRRRLFIRSSAFFLTKDLRCFMANLLQDIEPGVWGHLSGIRSLVVTRSELKEIPSAINQLIHMRHLDLSRNERLQELPEEICELYNLWTLIINLCDNLKRLPLGMGNKLVNLKHFENEQVPAPLPKSIGRLTRLKTLTEFRIHKDQGEEGGGSIADLKNMNQLQGSLTVFGLRNVAGSYEVEQANFAKKTALTCLFLGFGNEAANSDNNNDEELLEAARPSTNLEELTIAGYIGASISPSWMVSLSNLTRLSFRCCKEVKHLPPLGGLPSLEEVEFYEMDEVKKIGVEFLGRQVMMNDDIIVAFPRLSVLEFYGTAEWEEWDDTMLSSPSVMPRLSRLMLGTGYQLKKLPDAILQKRGLKQLEVNDYDSERMIWGDECGDTPEIFFSEVWDRISHIPSIIINGFERSNR